MLKLFIATKIKDEDIPDLVAGMLIQSILISAICMGVTSIYHLAWTGEVFITGLAIGLMVSVCLLAFQFGMSALLTCVSEGKPYWGIITGLSVLLILETIVRGFGADDIARTVFYDFGPTTQEEKFDAVLKLTSAFVGGYLAGLLASRADCCKVNI